jgi:hypothetical protein
VRREKWRVEVFNKSMEHYDEFDEMLKMRAKPSVNVPMMKKYQVCAVVFTLFYSFLLFLLFLLVSLICCSVLLLPLLRLLIAIIHLSLFPRCLSLRSQEEESPLLAYNMWLLCFVLNPICAYSLPVTGGGAQGGHWRRAGGSANRV